MNQWDAAAQGRVQRMETLLKKKTLNVNAMDLFQLTALDYAVMNGQLEISKMLIEAGADLNKKTDGETPIFKAIAQGNRNMVKLLLELGASTKVVRTPTKYEGAWTPLQRASMFEDTEITSMIKEHASKTENGVARSKKQKKEKEETENDKEEKEEKDDDDDDANDEEAEEKEEKKSSKKKRKSTGNEKKSPKAKKDKKRKSTN